MATLTTSSAYTLTQADVTAFNTLITAQASIGQGQTSVGQTELLNFFSMIRNIAYDQIRHVQNPQVKSWIYKSLDLLGASSTNYTINGQTVTGAGMFVLYLYYDFITNAMDWPTDFLKDPFPKVGYPAGYFDTGSTTWFNGSPDNAGSINPWYLFGSCATSFFQAPNTYNTFFNVMNSQVSLLQHDIVSLQNSTQTVALRSPGENNSYAAIQQFQMSRFDPAHWTNSASFVSAFTGSTIYSDQANMLKAMVTSSTMESGDYYFMLYLLISMSMGSAAHQTMAENILNTVTNSFEYPNDTFSNSLCYFIMMEFVDPMGQYSYNNEGMLGAVADLESIIIVNTAASAIIKTSLERQRKILSVDSSYPFNDPYSNETFNTRQSDIASALDGARTTMSIS